MKNNVIKLLEKIGQNAELQQLDAALLQKVCNPLDLDEQVQNAILQQDNQLLEQLLNARNKVVCAICLPEEEPVVPAEDKPVETPEKEKEDEKALVGNGW